MTAACRNTTCPTVPTDGYADRGLCALCEQRSLTALAGLPAAYNALPPLIRVKPATGISGGSSGKPGPAVPLNLHVDALIREIDWVTAVWAEIVRDRAGLSPICGTVADRCRTLATHWPVWISARYCTIVEPDHTINIVDGIDGILHASRLAGTAEATIGQTARTVALPVPCPDCRWPAMRHRDGADTVYCAHCGVLRLWAEYAVHVDLLSARL